MNSTHDYIPRPDADFDQFFRGITQYVADKTALNSQYADWYNAYALTFNPHSPQITREKNRVRLTTERDFNSLLNGRHDGKLVIENIAPKLTRGKRKIVDETFRDTAQFKETVEDQITE